MNVALVIASPTKFIEELLNQLHQTAHIIYLAAIYDRGDVANGPNHEKLNDYKIKFAVNIISFEETIQLNQLLIQIKPAKIFHIYSLNNPDLQYHDKYFAIKNVLDKLNYSFLDINSLVTSNNNPSAIIYNITDLIETIISNARGQYKYIHIDANNEEILLVSTSIFNWFLQMVLIENQSFDILKVNFREIVRFIYNEIGVEIEFSGKSLSEKAVVLDVDENITKRYNFDEKLLKPGQTIIKSTVNQQTFSTKLNFYTNQKFEFNSTKYTIKTTFHSLLKEHINKALHTDIAN